MSDTSPLAQQPTHLDLVNAPERVGGQEAMRQMLPMLIEMLERDGPVIEAALAQGDTLAVSKLLHSLKGCMPIFCHEPVCSAVAALEFSSKSAPVEVIRVGYASLQPQLQQLKSEISLYMAA